MQKNQPKTSRVAPRLLTAPVVLTARGRQTRVLSMIVFAIALAAPLAAAEHRGVVKFGGLPVPGATVTASQGDKKLTAVTDDQGVYDFPNLSAGIWNIEVGMLGFETIKREIAVSNDAPSPEWDLKMQSFDQIKALAPAAPP